MKKAASTTSNRLLKRHEFLRVQRRGFRIHTACMTLIGHLAGASTGCAGITASKKLGKAHVRNFIKRRTRHLLRKHHHLISHLNIVIIGKIDLAAKPFLIVEQDFLRAVVLLGRQLEKRSPKKVVKT